MGLFDFLFGKKPVPPPQNHPDKEQPKAPVSTDPSPETPVPAPIAPSDPSKDPNMIRVFDGYGRELFISRQDWRDKVLLGNLEKEWNNPDGLYGMIVNALNDGFRSDVIKAAEQLHKIDPIRERATCIWGIVLMEENRLEEAETVFQEYLAKHGESGVILTNLAKVYSKRNQQAKAEEILWHGLEIDPNQDNGMFWYEAIHRERAGKEGSLGALRKIAALPKSWRAQAWLAKAALESRQLEEAMQFYRESLSRAGNPVPPDLLMQISGDLGNQGHLPELLELTLPHFDINAHGLMVGNNLIKAHLDLGQVAAAKQLVDQLYALKRPDWKQTLGYWDSEIAKTRIGTSSVKNPPKISMLTIEGPVWLKPASPAAELFPAKRQEGPVICFLGSSAKMKSKASVVEHQMSDAPGQVSRALPLFLAEQVEFGSTARVQTLVPWASGEESSGFVLCGGPWEDADAANYARQGSVKGDYVVVVHIDAESTLWEIELRILRTIDGKCLQSIKAPCDPQQVENSVPKLADQLLHLLQVECEAELLSPCPQYQIPRGPHFAHYALRLEQLLAARCAGMEGVNKSFLYGERNILDGNIQLCTDHPQNLPTRILLVQTLLAIKRARPEIIPEFKDKVALLQKEKPLSEPANSVIQRLLNEAFA